MKTFTAEAVFTVLSGTLLCPLDDLYGILTYLTGEVGYTHQIPRFVKECRPWILLQHPNLLGVTISKDWQADTEKAKAKFGTSFDLSPLPEDWHTRIDPVEEARAMVGDSNVFAGTAGRRISDQGRVTIPSTLRGTS